MSVRAYVEVLGNIGPHRMAELVSEGLVSDYYVRLGPGYEQNLVDWPMCERMVREKGGGMWGWSWCEADQLSTARSIAALDADLEPDGWCLNIEKPLEFALLVVLISQVAALGKPIVASVAGIAPQAEFDFRTLDQYGVDVEWQCYVDSGEGQPPDVAVTELCKPSRVHVGRRYRHVIRGKGEGWGEVADPESFASYRTKASYRLELEQSALWPPFVVKDRTLFDRDDWSYAGQLLGLVAYPRIRVALDTTRTAQSKRDLTGWVNLAASARLKGASKRGITVYLAEVTPDDVFAAIARGASS